MTDINTRAFEDYLTKLYTQDSTILDLKMYNCGFAGCSDCSFVYLPPYQELARKMTCAERLEKIGNWCNDHPRITTLNLSGNKDIKEQELVDLIQNLQYIQNLILVKCKIDCPFEIMKAAGQSKINIIMQGCIWKYGSPNNVLEIISLLDVCG